VNLELRLQPKQAGWLHIVNSARHSRLGLGGSRGGGKSKTIRDVQLERRFRFPKSTGWIFRRTHEELKDNHIKPLFADYPQLGEYWASEDRELRLPGGSTLGFKFAENYADILKFRGKQAMDVSVDESNLMREDEMRELAMCCRAPGYPDWQCKLMESFNPGGVGHNRLKRIYVDRNFLAKEIPEQYHFTPVYGWDNVAWSLSALAEDGLTEIDYYSWTDEQRFIYYTQRSQYGRDMDALPEPSRSQMLLGNFDSFEGQVFGILDAELHDLDQWLQTDAELQDFIHRCARWTGGLDHATTGTRAWTISALDPYDNRMVMDEVYLRNVLITEMVDEVKRVKRKYPKVDRDYIDPSTESDTQENSDELTSIQDEYRRYGLQTVVPLRSKISVGLDLMNKMLRIDMERRHPFTGEMGSPSFFISRSRCPNLWREMTELQCIVRDGKIKYVGADHATDTVRYKIIAHMKPPKEPPKPADVERTQNTVTVLANRSHDKWAQKFDKKVSKGGRSYF